ncbi:MAG: RelA/SpoT domain-containing protein [Bacteroidia bacterium]|nr:RelA/SpoT domain-containing protein [Bacteroidia bacterium]
MEAQTKLYSKNELIRLGDKLRLESKSNSISDDSLKQIHDLRLSYKKVLSEVFNILSEESKKIRKSRVITYRIKRIESIISKLNRFPNMELGKMIDIGGCRCIVDSVQDIFQIADLLEKKLNITKRQDYINNKPLDDDGYSALHLYVKCKEGDQKPIEIQLRTKDQHNWATFVEIIDVVYNTKIKEGQKNPELQRFCYLLSDTSNLNHDAKMEILTIERDYNIYRKLSAIFNQNNIQTRKQWIKVEETNHKFFIIEVNEQKRTNIESFLEFDTAEDAYLKRFNNDKTNIVLTHLESPSYKLISIAYSNYILSMHKFQEDLCNIAVKAIEELILLKNKTKAAEIKSVYKNYINEEIHTFNDEVEEFKNEIKNGDKQSAKIEEWVSDLSERMSERASTFTNGDIEINLSFPETIILWVTNILNKFKHKA